MVSAWLIWLIAAGVLAVAEVMSLDFVLLMCAGGAAAGGAAAAAGAPVSVQVVTAAAVAAVLVFFVRPVAKRHLVVDGVHETGTAALVGRQAVVLSQVDAVSGRVRLNGSEWSARSLGEGKVFSAGTKVRVAEIAGATAVVFEEPFAEPFAETQ
jgi:membrane protein implicated in regulation of membrane protease activity